MTFSTAYVWASSGAVPGLTGVDQEATGRDLRGWCPLSGRNMSCSVGPAGLANGRFMSHKAEHSFAQCPRGVNG